jgi:hypothetical protein
MSQLVKLAWSVKSKKFSFEIKWASLVRHVASGGFVRLKEHSSVTKFIPKVFRMARVYLLDLGPPLICAGTFHPSGQTVDYLLSTPARWQGSCQKWRSKVQFEHKFTRFYFDQMSENELVLLVEQVCRTIQTWSNLKVVVQSVSFVRQTGLWFEQSTIWRQ